MEGFGRVENKPFLIFFCYTTIIPIISYLYLIFFKKGRIGRVGRVEKKSVKIF